MQLFKNPKIQPVVSALLVWICSSSLALLACLEAGLNPFASQSWIHWDSGIYIRIAKFGYSRSGCFSEKEFLPGGICGTVGWLPGYPALIKFSSLFGISIDFASALLPALFSLGVLCVVSSEYLPKNTPISSRILTVFSVGFFPGCIYFHAAFPLSLLFLTELLFYVCWQESKFMMASFFGVLCGMSYHTGFLAAAAPLTLLMIGSKAQIPPWPRSLARFASALSPIMGIASVFIVQLIWTGKWDGFLEIRKKYGVLKLYPMETLYNSVANLWRWPPGELEWTQGLQTTLVLVLLVLVCSRYKQIWQSGARSQLLLISSIAFWIFPHLVGGNASFYRGESALCGLGVIMVTLPKSLRFLLLTLFIGLYYEMSFRFFANDLI